MEEEILISVAVDQEQERKQVLAITDAITKLKNENKALTDQNRNLSKSAGDNSKAINRNNAQIELNRASVTKLNSERRNSIKAIQAEDNSLRAIKARLAANKLERDGLNLSLEEGQEQFRELTKAIKEDNDALLEAEKAAGQYSRQVGNYQEALEGIPGPAGQVVQSIKGMIAAAKAFIATPLGIVLTAIVGIFALVTKAMGRSEERTNKLRGIFTVFSGVVNKLISFLEPLAEFLVDNIVVAFDKAGKAADFALGLIADGLDLLGFDKAADNTREFAGAMEQAAQDAAKLAEVEATLQKRQRESERIQLEFQKNAEVLRQIRDDESKSIQERTAANEKLGKVLQEQLKEELAIRKLALQAANLRIKLEGETTTNLEAREEALKEIADVEERITGQQSEQLVNINALRKEETEKNTAVRKGESDLLVFRLEQQGKLVEAERLRTQELLSNEKLTQAQRQLIIEQSNAKIQQLEDQRLQRLMSADEALTMFRLQANVQQAQGVQARFDAEKALEQQRVAFLLDNENLLESERQLIIEQSNEKIRQLESTLTEDLNQERLEDFEKRQEEREQERERLTEFAIFRGDTEKSVRDLVKQFNEETLEDLKNTFGEQSVEYQRFFNQVRQQSKFTLKDLIDSTQRATGQISSLLSGQAQAQALERQNELDDIQIKENEKLAAIQQRLENGTISEQEAEMLRTQITEEADKQRLRIERRAFEDNKRRQITESRIDTFNAAIAAYRALAPIPIVGPGLGALAAVAALDFGNRQTQAIRNQKFVGSFKHGGYVDIDGKPHSEGGTKWYSDTGQSFEAEKGEGLFILKKAANDAFKGQLSGLNVAYGGKSWGAMGSGFLQEGGAVNTFATDSLNRSIENNFNLRIDLLEAIQQVPPPQVDVRRITAVSNQVEVVRNRASQ